jgi:hypothetical protein
LELLKLNDRAYAMQISDNGYSSSLSGIKSAINTITQTSKPSGNSLPSNPSDKHSTSKHSTSVSISQAAHDQSIQATQGLIDMSGEDGGYKLGLMALGNSTIQGWADQGLALTKEAVIAAGEAFQQAFSQMQDESDGSFAGSSLALNKYQVVMDSQQTPDWFKQEYESVLASMDNNEMKDAFQQGELFVTSKASSLNNANALANYSTVANIR